MAKTTIPVELSSTPGITDNSNATAITINSSENVTFAAGITSTAAANTLGATSFNEADLTNVGTIYADQYLGDADADSGIVLPGSDVMTLHTNNAERARIDSAGRFAIGVNNPADYYATNLVVQGASEGGITIASTSTSVWNYIMFADGTSGDARYRGYFGYNHSNDSLAIAAGGTQRLRVDSDGLKFGSDTAAANALDDYEEGTWTPTLGGATLTTATGKYTKIGNQVTVYYHVVTSGGLPTSSADVQVGGLPFTIDSNGAGAIYARYYTLDDSSLTTILVDGDTYIRLVNVNEESFDYTHYGELEASHNNSLDIRGTASYIV